MWNVEVALGSEVGDGELLTPPFSRGSLGATWPANWRPSLTASMFLVSLMFMVVSCIRRVCMCEGLCMKL